MGITIKPGEPLNLSAQLERGESDRGILAYVIDQVGDAITGSPFTLDHSAVGAYQLKNDSITFPVNSIQLTVTFEVYTDLTLTALDPKYLLGHEIYRKLEVETTEILQTIVAGKISADFSSNKEISAVIKSSNLAATVEKDKLVASVGKSINITASLDSKKIFGVLTNG